MANIIKSLKNTFYDFSLLPAVSDCDSNSYITYLQLAADIDAFHAKLDSLGVSRGDKVVLCGRNTSLWISAYMACLCHGAVAVPVSDNLEPRDIEQIISHSGSRVFAADKKILEAIDCSNMGTIVLDKTEHASLRGYNLNAVQYNGGDEEDPAICLYSSCAGKWEDTTITLGTLNRCVDNCLRSGLCAEGTAVLSTRPLAHSFGCIYDVLAPLVCGAQLFVLNSSKSIEHMKEKMAEIKPVLFCTSPATIEAFVRTHVEELFQKKAIRPLLHIPAARLVANSLAKHLIQRALGGKVQHIYMGGDTLERDVEEVLRDCHIDFTVNYGMTMDGPLSYCSTNFSKKKEGTREGLPVFSL